MAEIQTRTKKCRWPLFPLFICKKKKFFFIFYFLFFCRGGFCSNPCKLIVLFGEPNPQDFGFQVTWEVRIFTLWAWLFSLTSVRNAPHSWFISLWSYHECTTNFCRGGFCSNPCKLIVLFGEPSPQGFGFQATWEV